MIAAAPRRRRTRSADASGEAPYWALLPGWLAMAAPRAARRGSGLSRSALRDCIRGQEELFLAIRLHDDLLDGDDPDRNLVLRGDRALIEAERLFARHLGRHAAFWTFYRSAVDATLVAIEDVTALERRPGAFGLGSLRLHAKVGSIFKVGAAAVLAAQGRLHTIRRLNSLVDSLAVAGQILDDVDDLRADLERGRYTFVANVLLSGMGRPHRHDRVLASSFLQGRYGAVFDEARRRLGTAARSARRLALPEAESHVAAWVRALDTLETRYHRARVDALFAPLVRSGGAPR